MDCRDGKVYERFEHAPDDARPYMRPIVRPLNDDQTKRMKIGRNDPCPCGSKKKFKSCCKMAIARGEIDISEIEDSVKLA